MTPERSPMPKLHAELMKQNAEDRARETRRQLRIAQEIAKEYHEIELLKKYIPTPQTAKAHAILLATLPVGMN